MKIGRINVLGVGISVINMEIAIATITNALQRRQKGYVCAISVHSVMEAHDDPALLSVYNRALLCTPDGMPTVWMGKLAGVAHMDRVCGPDLMLELCGVSRRAGWRHFLYGGCNGTVCMLEERLKRSFPGLKIVGTYEPPFRPLNTEEENALCRHVESVQPDLFWVGISSPKQDRFMAEFLPRLATTVMLGVGAAFDIHSGRTKRAPRWMQRSGFEWFFRLCQEPRRLWRRYLRSNPRFLFYASMQLLSLRCKGPIP